jgi:hypothetical protein
MRRCAAAVAYGLQSASFEAATVGRAGVGGGS